MALVSPALKRWSRNPKGKPRKRGRVQMHRCCSIHCRSGYSRWFFIIPFAGTKVRTLADIAERQGGSVESPAEILHR